MNPADSVSLVDATSLYSQNIYTDHLIDTGNCSVCRSRAADQVRRGRRTNGEIPLKEVPIHMEPILPISVALKTLQAGCSFSTSSGVFSAKVVRIVCQVVKLG
jgi:hypothetical protein